MPCDNCDLDTVVLVAQGISCARCGVVLCDNCFLISKAIHGTLGDKNDTFPQKIGTASCMSWPFDEYYPENYGLFGCLRGCVMCTPAPSAKLEQIWAQHQVPI